MHKALLLLKTNIGSKSSLSTTYAKKKQKKTDHDIKKVKIVKVFKEIRTIAILMRKDVRNPRKLVW